MDYSRNNMFSIGELVIGKTPEELGDRWTDPLAYGILVTDGDRADQKRLAGKIFTITSHHPPFVNISNYIGGYYSDRFKKLNKKELEAHQTISI